MGVYLFLYGMACLVRYASYSCNLTWFLVSKILCFIRLPLSKFQAQLGIRPTGLGGLVYHVTGSSNICTDDRRRHRRRYLPTIGTLEGLVTQYRKVHWTFLPNFFALLKIWTLVFESLQPKT